LIVRERGLRTQLSAALRQIETLMLAQRVVVLGSIVSFAALQRTPLFFALENLRPVLSSALRQSFTRAASFGLRPN
jgi:hypothetical protein